MVWGVRIQTQAAARATIQGTPRWKQRGEIDTRSTYKNEVGFTLQCPLRRHTDAIGMTVDIQLLIHHDDILQLPMYCGLLRICLRFGVVRICFDLSVMID